ncbi:MAG: ABC transporter substrate-binding protein [Propionibacteriaceae bacterium]
MREGRAARLVWSLIAALSVLGLVACTAGNGTGPSSTPTATGARPFTVMSTDPIRVADPAAITDAGSTVLSLNVFQRLMTAEPGESVLKPDAARDCLFTSATSYTCTLNKKLFFHNGHPLTSSDVKFSIERAARLDVAGSSASLLSSMRRIETPDPLTVRFVLSRVDTQFGWALASPSASIVDEEVYDPDEVRPPTEPIIGSGPFSVNSFSDSDLLLARNLNYVGRNPGRTDIVDYRTVADSAAIEEAMSKHTVDVVWRGLNAAAVTRFSQQAGQNNGELTTDGFAITPLTGVRVRELQWAPSSAKRQSKPVRDAIEAALQEDRTLTSVVPGGVPGHVNSFPVGGRGKPQITWDNRIQLSLGYDPTVPDARDIATQIRTRLEDTGGLSVRVRPDLATADLMLVDRKAWTATALAWLQPYVDAPLTDSRATVTKLENDYRSTTNEVDANRLLTALQKQAAIDSVVLPVSQGDEYMFARDGVDINENSFGPGWQLGLFGMKNG